MGASEGSRGPVVLTREPPDNDELAAALAVAGFPVLEWPATATRWLAPEGGPEGLRDRIERAGLVAFTSRRAVAGARRLLGEALAPLLAERERAAVGPATARALEEAGAPAGLVAEGRGWRELAERLLATTAEGERLLLVRSAAADAGLPQALVAAGRLVDDVRLHGPGEPEPVREAARPLAAVACASPTAARLLLAWNPWAAEAAWVAIGPTTAEALRGELGVRRVVVAGGTTTADLLAAVERAARDEEPRP